MKLNQLIAGAASTLVITLGTIAGISANASDITAQQQVLIERHLIPMEGGRNFRDLGGYQTADGHTIKEGKLFRSGVLHHLTDADYERIESLGISTIVDFRASEEREREPTHWQAGDVEMLNWDYSMGLDSGEFLSAFANPAMNAAEAEALMGDMYRDMIEQQRPHYAALFQELAESDAPTLFHCSAGKDRTGIAAALVLTALGVDRETVINDYTLSEVIATLPEQQAVPQMTEEMEEAYSFLADLPPVAIDALMGTRPSYLEAAMDEMTAQYGSVDAYIEEGLDVSDGDIARIRKHFLE